MGVSLGLIPTVLWRTQIVLAINVKLFLATGFETGTPYAHFVIEG